MALTQTSTNVLVAIKRETVTGTAATASGATQMRITASAGLELKRAEATSKELRADGLRTMGRLAARSVTGSYTGEVSVGGALDILYEAILRGTWQAAVPITVDNTAAHVSFQVTGTSAVAYVGTTTLLTAGLRAGDVGVFTNMSSTANNNINFRVASVAGDGLSFTTYGNPLTIQSADTSATLTILKKVIVPATPTRYSHTLEQYDIDIDLSELFLGCRLVGLKLSAKPGAQATWQATFLGMDRTVLTTGTSPWFTSPSLTTGLGLISDDSSISLNGAAAVYVTGFDLDFTIGAKTEPVIGEEVSPDVYDTQCVVTGSLTGIRSDFARVALFEAETEFEVSLLLEEPTATAPKPCVGIYLPRVKITGLSAPVKATDGAKIETLPIEVAPIAASTGVDAGVAAFHSSAP